MDVQMETHVDMDRKKIMDVDKDSANADNHLLSGCLGQRERRLPFAGRVLSTARTQITFCQASAQNSANAENPSLGG